MKCSGLRFLDHPLLLNVHVTVGEYFVAQAVCDITAGLKVLRMIRMTTVNCGLNSDAG